MGDTWIIDMTHYLDEEGCMGSLPPPARRVADHFGAIAMAMRCGEGAQRRGTGWISPFMGEDLRHGAL